MLARKLSEYAYSLKYSDLSEKTIERVKKHFLDALGSGINAHNAPPVKVIKKSLHHDHTETNALLYGAMIRYLDFDDWYPAKSREPAHPNDNFGGVLAAAEHNKVSTKDFILAAALGYEIQCQLCDAGNLRANGWDHVIYGAISQALAVGKLMSLNTNQLTQTVNLNLSTNISSRQVRESTELSMWKAAAFSNVARNAVFFAKLAKNGMEGPNNVFEGKYGMMNMLTCAGLPVCKFNLDFKSFGKSKSPFRIEYCWMKNWPAEIHSQSAIQAALELREALSSLDEIKSIHVDSHEAGFTIIGSGKEKWAPKTKETADHSIPYLVSTALMFGDIKNEYYSTKYLNNKKLLNLISKVTVSEDKNLTKLYPGAAANRVTITLKSGEKLVKEVKYHKGHSNNPLTNEEVEAKFRKLTNGIISKQKQDKIIKDVWNLDRLKSFDWGLLKKI